MTFNKIIAMHCKYNNPTYSPQSILSDLAKFYPNLFEANFWQSPRCFQVGSFNYDNTKMVFNDSFIAEEGAIRWFHSLRCVWSFTFYVPWKKKQIIAMNIKCLNFVSDIQLCNWKVSFTQDLCRGYLWKLDGHPLKVILEEKTN